MLIKELGEFGLIGRLMNGKPVSSQVVKGVGDDAAVIEVNPEARLLVTGDMMVEGTHFLRERISPYDLGCKLMAVNLSDIAAMAGTPKFAVSFLGLPPDITVEEVEEIYRGAQSLAGRHGVAIIGGDTVRSPVLTLGITLLGEGLPDRTLLRCGAREGDILGVTGTLGGSAAGLAVLLGKVKVDAAAASRAIEVHCRPQPRVMEGLALGALGCVRAMIDISDGLASEVGHLCRESRVGVNIWGDEVPIDDDTRAISREMGKSPLDLALYGGEDYELLFAVNPDGWQKVKESMDKLGTRVTAIGRFTADEGSIEITVDGKTAPLSVGGYNHFT